jgi:hypothetical protein
MVSSGILRRVALVKTDVSKERSASFIRVTRIGERGSTVAVTINRRTLRRNTKLSVHLAEWVHASVCVPSITNFNSCTELQEMLYIYIYIYIYPMSPKDISATYLRSTFQQDTSSTDLETFNIMTSIYCNYSTERPRNFYWTNVWYLQHCK